MIHGIVEITSDHCYTSKHLGFLRIKLSKDRTTHIDLDEIDALVLSARSGTISRALLTELGRRDIPLIVAGENYQPEYIGLPIATNTAAAPRITAQVMASKPKKKRIWQAIVQAKIIHQSWTLQSADKPRLVRKLQIIANSVKSGDATNREAYAARLYWKELFGNNFSRNREAPGVNAQLNYGYGILRALVARAVVSTGLSPSIGVHHSNQHNPLCLVDDLMEPFRPVVDRITFHLHDEELNPNNKRLLAAVGAADFFGKKGITTLSNAAYELATSLCSVMSGAEEKLTIPTWNPSNEIIENPERI